MVSSAVGRHDWRFGGSWLLVALGLALLPAGLIALTWQERLTAFRRRALGFLHFRVHRDRHVVLVARRRALVRALESAMRDQESVAEPERDS